MDDEIEDMVGDVLYTDSQKSIATCISNIYSHDFTDSSSDKNNSSGKDTYLIECDSSEDSDKPFQLYEKKSVINLHDKRLQIDTHVSKSTSTNVHKYSIVAEEIFTQTSKTIMELAENDTTCKKMIEKNTLQTQTSFTSVTDNKTVEYTIQVSNGRKNFTKTEFLSDRIQKKPTYFNVFCNKVLSNSLEEESSKCPASEPASETENETSDNKSESSNDRIITIIDDENKEIVQVGTDKSVSRYDSSNYVESAIDSEMEEDSLNETAINNDVQDLHNKLSVDLDLRMPDRFSERETRRFGTLTPLTEESTMRKDSLMDITPNFNNVTDTTEEKANKNDVVFKKNTGLRVKYLEGDNRRSKDNESLKLPPIKNLSCPNSPRTTSMGHGNKTDKLGKASLPGLFDEQKQRDSLIDRWEIGTKGLASGESPLISDRSEPPRRTNNAFHLPPIYTEGHPVNRRHVKNATHQGNTNANVNGCPSETLQDTINITDKIKELKNNAKSWTKYSISRTNSRSGSPSSTTSPDDMRLNEIADRGCEALCIELMKRLRSSSWYDVVDTLDEIPKALEKFWAVITEQRIADIIRIVNGFIESPRPQLARSACTTAAAILKNTNYTKKPDFYEVVTVLLIKTGSYSRPVRRAANVALDEIVCGVDLSHSVTALCIHGVGHKSALVRCASARLLVVCSALARGGRDLLRSRPASAASARRHALRALAALLDDKSAEARKYAERLYSMLRPLTNFEAYYLTDVDIDLASKQMKKYDQLLLCGPPKEVR